MLTVSRKQMDVLGKSMQDRFERRMVAHLRHSFPERTKTHGDEVLQNFVQAGLARCRPYGVVNELDAQRFLDYMVIYGPEFDQKPDTAWAGLILDDPNLTGTQKMDQIDDYDMFAMNR
ncbi:MAG: hypothetical protein PHU46_15605 [Rhodocyclaceae bacterium]|nr:hypothetical protein [Rhodocyclaceae bacterium]